MSFCGRVQISEVLRPAQSPDLCRRLAECGWSSVYVPSAVITHQGGHATSRAAGPMLREHHRALFRYLSRQYAGPAWVPVRAVGEGAAPTRSAAVLDEHR